jgi:hypothetical protein
VSESAVTIKDILLLVQAAIVLGGGFFFAGRLGAKLDSLGHAIDALRSSLHVHSADLKDLGTRVTTLEASKRDS